MFYISDAPRFKPRAAYFVFFCLRAETRKLAIAQNWLYLELSCLEIMTRTIDQKLTFTPTVIMARRLMALVCSCTIGYTFANNKMTGSISCTKVFT